MANVVLKSDFRDGDLLFAQQLNNNFKAIQKALETMNGIVWQDTAEMVVTFRGTTEEINERDIIDGQILYDVLTGETYIDYDGKRISTGSGNAIHIGEDEPTNQSTQLWIESDAFGNMLSEVVNTLEGNSTNKAPSISALNKVNTYSTEETFTGKYWIDGKKIYRKVIHIESLPSDGDTHFQHVCNHNIDGVDLIWFDLAHTFLIFNGDTTNTLPLFNPSFITQSDATRGAKDSIYLTDATKTDFKIVVGRDRSNVSAYVTLEYTKMEDSSKESEVVLNEV